MKLYHKFFLYQNKWIHPYIRVALGVMTALTYLASILLIVGLVYEHGFTISAAEAVAMGRNNQVIAASVPCKGGETMRVKVRSV